MRKAHRLLLVLFLLVAVTNFARGADGWTNLKVGMTAEQTSAAIGTPVLRTEGRGFEIWTYDNRSEVVFYGDVIAWTAPASSPAAQSIAGTWSFNQGRSDSVMLQKPPRRKFAQQRREAEARVFLPLENYGSRFKR